MLPLPFMLARYGKVTIDDIHVGAQISILGRKMRLMQVGALHSKAIVTLESEPGSLGPPEPFFLTSSHIIIPSEEVLSK